MSFAYYKIDNITQNGFELFYKKPIDIAIHKATLMDSKHFYYFKSPYVTEYRPLGQFNTLNKRSSNCRYNDYDYDVYEFTDDYISCSEKDNIYCIGIPESGEKMVEIKGMLYQEYQIYMLSK
jgi:hypothetical protein